MAGNTFYLKIIAANRVFYAGRCRSLIVPEYDGQKEILAHHEDMVIAIDEGEMRFQPEGTANWEYAVVGMGFVEIIQEYYHSRASLSRALTRLKATSKYQ